MYRAMNRGRLVGMSGLGEGEMDELSAILGGGGGSGGSVGVSLPGVLNTSSAGNNWSGFWQDLAKQWTKIGGQILAPTYQTDAAGNTVYRQPTGGTSTGIAPGGSFASMSGGTMLLLGGGLLLGVVVIKSMSGGRR